MKCSTLSCPSNSVEVFHGWFFYFANHLAAADLLDFTVQMVHHIWQLQAFWPTCWTWWIVKRPSGCMFWPSLPRAFLSFFHFVSSSSTYALCLLIIRTSSLHTPIYYIRSSVCLRCSDCWRFSSTLQTGLILNKGEGLELVVFQHSRGERRKVCVPGTRFLQHAVTSLQLSPSLMLPDRWGCVCMLFHAFCSWGWVRKEEGWGWWGGEGGGQPTGYG